MKKILTIGLSIIICFIVVGCGTKTEDIIGTYKNTSFLKSSEFTLNENATYDRTLPNEKGTYKAGRKGGFTLTDTNDDETIFAKKDNYYYRTNLICCFEEDKEYGQKPSFSENGVSNQWFSAYYEGISDNSWKVIILELKEDKTFKLRDCVRDSSGHQSEGTVYEGTYNLDNYVLNLECADNQAITLLFINEKLYFDVFVKE